MRRVTLLAIAMGLSCLSIWSTSASAQASRTWVSGVGDDANPCSRTAPCKTFAGAISKTAASGEINCVDPGGFGAVTITKAITISCEAGTAGVLVAGTNGIVVSAGGNDNVYLKGLDIEGLGTGLSGILFNSGSALFVQDTVIRGFNASPGFGISFTPNVTASLSVLNTVIHHNGTGSAGGGITIAPTGAAVASALLNKVSLEHNFTGASAVSVGPGSALIIMDSTISANLSTGLSASGPGGSARIGNSAIVNNGGAATSGANVESYGNNQINNNNPDTTPTLIPLR
jgi:hypothetical protein